MNKVNKKYEDLVVYQVAVLAKEIGFNEGCRVSYIEYLKDGDGKFHDTQYKAGEVYYSDMLYGWNKDYPRTEYYEQYAAPTRSQYSWWLVRNHGIVVHCTPEKNQDGSFHWRVSLYHHSWEGHKQLCIMKRQGNTYVEQPFEDYIKAYNYGLWKASQFAQRGSVLN